MLDEWTAALARDLGVELDIDINALLEVARDAAHNVLRPAAPITTFLVGYAAAMRGGGPAAVADACSRASALALAWEAAAQASASEAPTAGGSRAGQPDEPPIVG